MSMLGAQTGPAFAIPFLRLHSPESFPKGLVNVSLSSRKDIPLGTVPIQILFVLVHVPVLKTGMLAEQY